MLPGGIWKGVREQDRGRQVTRDGLSGDAEAQCSTTGSSGAPAAPWICPAHGQESGFVDPLSYSPNQSVVLHAALESRSEHNTRPPPERWLWLSGNNNQKEATVSPGLQQTSSWRWGSRLERRNPGIWRGVRPVCCPKPRSHTESLCLILPLQRFSG